MLDLGLAVALEGLGVGREAGGVPAVVAGELSGQVVGSVGGEGSEPLGTVGAVPDAVGDGGLGHGAAHGGHGLAHHTIKE